MHTLLEIFQNVGKYSDQVASHKAELRIEERFFNKKYLSISDLQIEYLHLDNLIRNNERGKLPNQGVVTV